MDNMTAQMAEQLKNNPAMLRSLMQSHDGQKLMQLLTNLLYLHMYCLLNLHIYEEVLFQYNQMKL